MNKYTNALYPDKINDLVDNDGNVNIKQPWTPFQLNYSFEDLIAAITNQELHDEIEDDFENKFAEIAAQGIVYIEFITSDNVVFRGTCGMADGDSPIIDSTCPFCSAGFKDDHMIRIYNGTLLDTDYETPVYYTTIKIEAYRFSQHYDEETGILHTNYEPLVTE